jgi:hypothetical protein
MTKNATEYLRAIIYKCGYYNINYNDNIKDKERLKFKSKLNK